MKKKNCLALLLAAVLCLTSCVYLPPAQGEVEEKPPQGETPVEEEAPPVRPAVPITAAYQTSEAQYDHVYQTTETEYVTYMVISIQEDLRDVTFGLMEWDGAALHMAQPLYRAPAMAAGETFLASVVFYGDMTTYGIEFTDPAGDARSFSLVISGKDGSLECIEEEKSMPPLCKGGTARHLPRRGD